MMPECSNFMAAGIPNPVYRVVGDGPSKDNSPFCVGDVITVDPDGTWAPERWLLLSWPGGKEDLATIQDPALYAECKAAGVVLGTVVQRLRARDV